MRFTLVGLSMNFKCLDAAHDWLAIDKLVSYTRRIGFLRPLVLDWREWLAYGCLHFEQHASWLMPHARGTHAALHCIGLHDHPRHEMKTSRGVRQKEEESRPWTDLPMHTTTH